MANNYYQMTGVLTLERVTPVIRALFGGFHLDAHYPGKGHAYIALTDDDYSSCWDDIIGELFKLAASLGVLPQEKEEDADAKTVLSALAAHFHVDEDEALRNLIEQYRFEDCADLNTLFLLATLFDDGHRLAAIEFEGCWHCSKPRLFEFGGDACFLSRTVRLFDDSYRIRAFGGALYSALRAEDVDAASTLIAHETARLLDCIQDSPTREAVRQHLIEHLAEFPAKSDIPF
jgi:hypothetical protein